MFERSDDVTGQKPFFPFGRRNASLALVWGDGDPSVVDFDRGLSRTVEGWVGKPDSVVVSPAFASGELVSVPILTRRLPPALAVVRPSVGPGNAFEADQVDVSTDAGLPIDAVVGVPSRSGLWIIALRDTSIVRFDEAGVTETLGDVDTLPAPEGGQARGTQMRTDVGGRLLAINRNGVLSTFLINVDDVGLALTPGVA